MNTLPLDGHKRANNSGSVITLEQSKVNYERHGYCIFHEQVVPDDILVAAQHGMMVVRNGIYDLNLPPTEHPGYDPNVPCKINDPYHSNKGLYRLVKFPEIGQKTQQQLANSRYRFGPVSCS